MKLILNDRDLSELYKEIKWSGDKKQRTRSLSASYLYKKGSGFPEVEVRPGDTVGLFADDGSQRFIGIVKTVENTMSGNTVKMDCSDILWYLGRNKVAKVYQGSADAITREVCASFNIQIGTVPALEEQKTVISTGDKTIHQVIQEAYGSSYYIYADQDGKVSVEATGSEVVAVLSGNGNLLDATYKSSIESMVNRILILDDKGNVVGSVQNEPDFVYGLLQDVYKQEKGKDALKEAKTLLKGKENTCTVECLGNWECIAGKAVYVMDVSNGMLGKYLITDDVHTFSDGVHRMSLGLEVMTIESVR